MMNAAAGAVAKQLGLGQETVRRWVVQSQVDAGDREGRSSGELAEIKALKAKVRRPEEDNAILKAATVFFAGVMCCAGVRWAVLRRSGVWGTADDGADEQRVRPGRIPLKPRSVRRPGLAW